MLCDAHRYAGLLRRAGRNTGGYGRVSCVETHNGDTNHATGIIQAELEPGLRSEICRESMEPTAVVCVVDNRSGVVIFSSPRRGADIIVGLVGLPVDIRAIPIKNTLGSKIWQL